MADVKGGLISAALIGARLQTVNLSGTVKVSAVGVVRHILIFRNGFFSTPYTTISDAAGDWSIDIYAGSQDTFKVIAVGAEGENSEIYDKVVGG